MNLTKEYLEDCAIDDTPAFETDEIKQILNDYEKARKWDSWPEVKEILRNQKLRELIEKKITECEKIRDERENGSWMEEDDRVISELEDILEESKK